MPSFDCGKDYNPRFEANLRKWEKFYLSLGCTQWKAWKIGRKKMHKECPH